MTIRSLVWGSIASVTALLGATSPVLAGPVCDESLALRRFERSVAAYVALRDRLDDELPPLEISADVGKIHDAVEARAAAMARARSGAAPGDLFDARVGTILRQRIDCALVPGYTPDADEDEDAAAPTPAARATVNGRFSWKPAVAMPANVLAVLPPLPASLQYRFVGRDLVLVDIDANLVIDVLPDVLPALAPAAPRR